MCPVALFTMRRLVDGQVKRKKSKVRCRAMPDVVGESLRPWGGVLVVV